MQRYSTWRMDVEKPHNSVRVPAFFSSERLKTFFGTSSKRKLFGRSKVPRNQFLTNPSALEAPWTESIASNSTTTCIYMPFWEWQLNRMEQDLTNFQVLPETCCYMESPAGQHRMMTLTASSDEYRYIRMTYMDGGDRAQVFTSVLYPRGNFPLFGIDLLQFNRGKRNLAICDYQPLHATEEEHEAPYEQLLEDTRVKFPHLHENMTDRFFDPSKYFSNHTLLGRFEEVEDPQETIWGELWPAYREYFDSHVKLVKQRSSSPLWGAYTGGCLPIDDNGTADTTEFRKLTPEEVVEHHRAYDNYVSERDPAHRMFAPVFGREIAERYIYDVLFPLADKPKN